MMESFRGRVINFSQSKRFQNSLTTRTGTRNGQRSVSVFPVNVNLRIFQNPLVFQLENTGNFGMKGFLGIISLGQILKYKFLITSCGNDIPFMDDHRTDLAPMVALKGHFLRKIEKFHLALANNNFAHFRKCNPLAGACQGIFYFPPKNVFKSTNDFMLNCMFFKIVRKFSR